MPSATPYEKERIDGLFPSANAVRSLMATRKTPRLEVIQRLPRPSSRIKKIASSKSPLRVVNVVNLPSLNWLRPLLVPSQSAPDESPKMAHTTLLERPLLRVYAVKRPFSNLSSPPPPVPT